MHTMTCTQLKVFVQKDAHQGGAPISICQCTYIHSHGLRVQPHLWYYHPNFTLSEAMSNDYYYHAYRLSVSSRLVFQDPAFQYILSTVHTLPYFLLDYTGGRASFA